MSKYLSLQCTLCLRVSGVIIRYIHLGEKATSFIVTWALTLLKVMKLSISREYQEYYLLICYEIYSSVIIIAFLIELCVRVTTIMQQLPFLRNLSSKHWEFSVRKYTLVTIWKMRTLVSRFSYHSSNYIWSKISFGLMCCHLTWISIEHLKMEKQISSVIWSSRIPTVIGRGNTRSDTHLITVLMPAIPRCLHFGNGIRCMNLTLKGIVKICPRLITKRHYIFSLNHRWFFSNG